MCTESVFEVFVTIYVVDRPTARHHCQRKSRKIAKLLLLLCSAITPRTSNDFALLRLSNNLKFAVQSNHSIWLIALVFSFSSSDTAHEHAIWQPRHFYTTNYASTPFSVPYDGCPRNPYAGVVDHVSIPHFDEDHWQTHCGYFEDFPKGDLRQCTMCS